MATKISALLSDEAMAALQNLAAKKGVTITEVLGQAISSEVFMAHVEDAGGKILVQEKDGKVQQIKRP